MRAVSQCRWDHVNKNARSRVVFCSISRAALKDLQCCISCQQVPSVFSIPPAWTHITSFLTRALIDHSNIRELEAIEQAKRRSFFSDKTHSPARIVGEWDEAIRLMDFAMLSSLAHTNNKNATAKFSSSSFYIKMRIFLGVLSRPRHIFTTILNRQHRDVKRQQTSTRIIN